MASGIRGRLSRVLLVDVIAPLAVFYGLPALGASQFTALLAGALIPLAGTAHDVVTRCRVSGVRIFVLATMALTVAMSFVNGSPRVMAVTFPIDLVPLLDDVLLVVTLAAVVGFQRFYGRSALRRNGLRMRGVHVERLAPA